MQMTDRSDQSVVVVVVVYVGAVVGAAVYVAALVFVGLVYVSFVAAFVHCWRVETVLFVDEANSLHQSGSSSCYS